MARISTRPGQNEVAGGTTDAPHRVAGGMTPPGHGLARLLRRDAAAQAVVAVLLVVVAGAPSLLYPFSRDQGEYAYIASAALDGKTVYAEIMNVKPPLTHLVHELALVAFGRSMVAIRLLDLVWQSATALILLFVGRRIYGQTKVGGLAAILYAISYYSGSYWATAQTDGFLNLPAALGILAFVAAREHGRERSWAFVACGAALGLATLFKYPIGILASLLALAAMWRRGFAGLRRAIAVGMGFALPLLGCAAALALDGSLQSFVYTQITYIPSYTIGHGDGLHYLASLVHGLVALSQQGLILRTSAGALLLVLIQEGRAGCSARTLPIGLWWLAAAVSLVVQNKPYAYLALPLLAPMSLLVARLLPMVAGRERALAVTRLSAFGIVGLFGLLINLEHMACTYTHNYRALIEVASGQRPLTAAYDQPGFGEFGGGESDLSPRYVELEVARYIESRTAPGETIFVWGFEPTVYFLSRRASASRFIYNYPLYGDFPWPQLQEECLAELERNAPRYILVVSHDRAQWISGIDCDSRAALARFDGLAQLINSQYTYEAEIGDFALHRRND